MEDLKEKCGIDKKKDLNLIGVDKYYAAVRKKIESKGKNKIAIVYAEGEIVDGNADGVISSEKFAKEIRKARKTQNYPLRANYQQNPPKALT